MNCFLHIEILTDVPRSCQLPDLPLPSMDHTLCGGLLCGGDGTEGSCQRWTSFSFQKTAVTLQKPREGHVCWQIDNGVLLLGGKKNCWKILQSSPIRRCIETPRQVLTTAAVEQLSWWLVTVLPPSRDLISSSRQSESCSKENSLHNLICRWSCGIDKGDGTYVITGQQSFVDCQQKK